MTHKDENEASAEVETNTSPKGPALRTAKLVALAVVLLLIGIGLGRSCGQDSASTETAPSSEEESSVWTCSMHPEVRRSEPGACPICGMDLVKKAEVEMGEAMYGSDSRFHLSERARVLANIRTTEVISLGRGGGERFLFGKVQVDESLRKTVTSWVDGRIDKLFINTTGEEIRRGQTVATLYSPEVFRAHQDLLVAKRQLAALSGASLAARSGAQAVLAASRDRLRLLGVRGKQLERLEARSTPRESVSIQSPFRGTVIERLVTEGAYVKTGTGLFQIADLSRVWVELDAYERDLAVLEKGQKVRVIVEALPDQPYEGRIAFLDPVVEPRTRTGRVRVEVGNEQGQLRPGMFVEAAIDLSRSRAEGEAEDEAEAPPAPLAIPITAPLFAGSRSLVYVELPGEEGAHYEPREVELGGVRGEMIVVLSGLEKGERVVTHGAFVLDADLQIRGGAAMMSRADDRERHEAATRVAPEVRADFGALIEHYLEQHQALAADDLQAAKVAARKLEGTMDDINPALDSAFARLWKQRGPHLARGASQLGNASDLEAARVAFRVQSDGLVALLREVGNPTSEPVHVAYCPMALDGQGAPWLQRSRVVENPYFGSSMHSCGELEHELSTGELLPQVDEASKTESESP